MSTFYKQERNHNNWTGRVSRQSRITSEWSRYHKASNRIPPVAYFVAGFAMIGILLACFL